MRQWTAVALTLALAGVTGVAAPALAGADDDLAVVKRAVASPSPAAVASATPSARGRSRAAVERAVASQEPRPEPDARPLARTGREPRWFKVRVVDRVSGRKKVTVNLPLSLVRALGDDTIDWDCRDRGLGERCRTLRISEVLRTLESGQELVEIEDDEASVRIWVE